MDHRTERCGTEEYLVAHSGDPKLANSNSWLNAARHNVAICRSPPLLFNVPDMSVAIPLMLFPYVSGGTTMFHSAGECRREGIDRVGTVRHEDRILRNWKETNPKYCGILGFLKGWQGKSVAGSLHMCI